MNAPPPDALPFDAVGRTRFGFLALRLQGAAVTQLVLRQQRPVARADAPAAAAAALRAVQRYLEQGDASALPRLALRGTAFQRRVWRALRRIPRGETRTYGQLARQLATSARAVGGACRANPVLILVPCHRVVASTGYGGFAGRSAGHWTDLKRRLLAAEGVRLP
jgi:methylated-DNA-[protein]-cysteine S-methyltransferase